MASRTPETGHSEWEQVLDGLERAVAEAEKMLLTLRPHEIAPWEVPALDSPMPWYLLDRAHALAERQQRVLDSIPFVLDRLRQQRTLTDRISRATARPRTSVYIDASA